MAPASNAFTPGKAIVIPPNLRGVAGMSKLVKANTKQMVVDIEYPSPMVLLVTGEVDPTAAASLALVNWEIATGIAQGQLNSDNIQAQTFSRIVLARSVQVVVENPSDTLDAIVKIVIVPIDATIDVTHILGTAPNIPVGPPNDSDPLFISNPGANTNQSFTSSLPLAGPFSVGTYIGASIRNESPAGANLYVFCNAGPAVIATHRYTQKIEPGGYFEVPFGYNGPIVGVWDANDAAGGAVCTFFGFQS